MTETFHKYMHGLQKSSFHEWCIHSVYKWHFHASIQYLNRKRESKVKKRTKYLHKSKEFLLNTNDNCHSFQVRCKVVSLHNLNSITTPPGNCRKKLGLQEERVTTIQELAREKLREKNRSTKTDQVANKRVCVQHLHHKLPLEDHMTSRSKTFIMQSFYTLVNTT